VRQRPEIERMIEAVDVTNLFQPLIKLRDGARFGFEMLGRGAVEGLPTSPVELFMAAERHGLELPLARALRHRGAREARRLPAGSILFFNTHPGELAELDRLVESLVDLRTVLPEASVVLEVHEMSITDVDAVRPFRERLADLDIGLAFDDFGKGRSRLLELAELAPSYLKFDRSLIQSLEGAERRRDLVSTLVNMVHEMGIETLAEGIETAAEAEVCTTLGFDYAQGYYFGRPEPAEAFESSSAGALTALGESAR
jgi:EAL domain-containing protein (putative c-di-GMP-specific phosphodiesterase class I)